FHRSLLRNLYADRVPEIIGTRIDHRIHDVLNSGDSVVGGCRRGFLYGRRTGRKKERNHTNQKKTFLHINPQILCVGYTALVSPEVYVRHGESVSPESTHAMKKNSECFQWRLESSAGYHRPVLHLGGVQCLKDFSEWRSCFFWLYPDLL